MAGRNFFKKRFVLVFLLLAVIGLPLFYQKSKPKDERLSGNTILDFELKKKLLRRIKAALSSYPAAGWEKTYQSLNEVRWGCRKESCDPEIFFNEVLDDLANTFASDREFTLAGITLGVVYSGNWRLADLDGDGKNEMIVLQRDALNVNYTLLKVINFLRRTRIANFRLPQGYFSSPNSYGQGTLPLDIREINGDSRPEVLVYVSPGRGGSDLIIFTYNGGRLDLIYKKDDVDYPEYTILDKDGGSVAKLTVEGFRSGKRVKESIKF